ncbi:hypothetical protein DZA50_04485 [Kangiella sp. HD9-110m-PIT-SAG07]|nr:hypothetical protein DZA50_04485 [Kangiella sp. HD9-110m-PIT-SAG07]
MSQDYLSLVGRSAASQEVQRFFREHKVSWNSVDLYQSQGVTEASLELYDSALEIEFIKKLSPRSSVTHQAKDFIISSITLVNHTDQSNQSIGQVVGPLRLTSRLADVTQTLGQNYDQNRYQGTYRWRKDDVIIEVDYETTQDQINYIVLAADTLEVRAVKEVAESLDGSLAQEASEDLGIELPDLPYEDEPVTLDYENSPVVERESGNRSGIMVLLALIIAALFFYDDIAQFILQLLGR